MRIVEAELAEGVKRIEASSSHNAAQSKVNNCNQKANTKKPNEAEKQSLGAEGEKKAAMLSSECLCVA